MPAIGFQTSLLRLQLENDVLSVDGEVLSKKTLAAKAGKSLFSKSVAPATKSPIELLEIKSVPAPRKLQFKNIANKKDFKFALLILEEEKYIDEKELNHVLTNFEKAQQDYKIVCELLCTNNKTADTKSILSFIKKCDNDQLRDLHANLLTDKFNYLRAKTGTFSFSFWFGTDQNGNVVRCSKSWATIEKAISLQRIQNSKQHSMGPRAAALIAHENKSFSIKRWGIFNNDGVSASFDAFVKKDTKTLEKKYSDHFGLK